MPPPNQPVPPKTIEEVVDELGVYPHEAFEFISRGLNYTVGRMHGKVREPDASHHVSGPQLCEGLRDFANQQWGMLAPTVLRRWRITETADFGRIVFTLVENGFMLKTEDDCLDDFKDVFDFATAFETGYRIEIKS